MDSRGGFGTVDLRDAINEGLIKGPRMQVAGQSLNQRASGPYPNPRPGFYAGFTENKNINGPWLARAAVREAEAARRRLDQDLHDAGLRRWGG